VRPTSRYRDRDMDMYMDMDTDMTGNSLAFVQDFVDDNYYY